MTGVILQAFNTVKNYFVHNFGQGGEGDRAQAGQVGQNFGGSEGQRHPGRPLAFSRFLPFGTGNRGDSSGSRKRPAERLIEFELEITDDEDEQDNPSWAVWNRKQNKNPTKRFRPLGEELGDRDNNMTDRNKKIITRGSGLTPRIAGLDKQPWEFNFKSKRSHKPKQLYNESDSNNSVSSVELSRGSLLKDAVPSTSKSYRQDAELSDKTQSNELSNSNMEFMNSEFRNFQFSKPTSVQTNAIEVITLDDEDGNRKNNTRMMDSFPPSRNDNRILQKKVKSQMKSKKNSKPFSNFISCLGQKAVDPLNNTIRLEERNMYAELIKKFESLKQPFGYGNSALQRSKLNKVDVQALYQKFPSGSGTSPKVTFKSRFDSTFTSPLSSSTPKLLDRIAHENSRRLFSTPFVPKTLALEMKPPIIDLETEDNDKLVNGIVSVSSPSSSMDGSSSVDLPVHSSFVDLDDALNSSLVPSAEKPESDKKDDDLEMMSNTSSKPDSDIAILSESILHKYKGRRLNSLALEQNLSPYINKGWLDELSSSFRENQKAREKQIREHLETIDVIQKESTLETDLRERMRKKLTLTEIIVLEEPIPELPEITHDMRQVIDLAKRPGRENEVLATVFNIDITRGDIKTLAPCKWLNDNVINIYMELIANRSKESSSYPKVHVFSTFFYPKLLKEGYSNTLKRWTRKVDVFSNNLVIFPIHLGLHWCLACADFRDKTLKYYDSLGGKNEKCLHALLNYLGNEMKERKGEILEKNDWELVNVKDIPMQQNGSDCGVFSCKFAEYLSRDSKLTFQQENMNYYRERMIYEILKKDLLHP